MADYTGCAVRPYAHQSGACDRCGTALPERRKRWCSDQCAQLDLIEHYWPLSREAAVRRDDRACTACGVTGPVSLEVNHIVPRVGRGYGTGCWNHLGNLETLCHDCHVTVTKEQVRQRRTRVAA